MKNRIFKKYRISRFLYDTLRKLYLFHVSVFFESIIVKWIKLCNIHNKSIRLLKDRFKGERCFIVCNGPSLNMSDLELLKNEYCFSMNSIIKILDKTSWRPKFFGIQDMFVYQKMPEWVVNCESEYIFIADEVNKWGLPYPENALLFNHVSAGNFPDNPKPHYKFSEDPSVVVYDGFSITYSLMQIACYLGFKEIYLIGCDCSYSSDPQKQHFVNSGHVDTNAYIIGSKQIEAYKKAKRYFDKHEIMCFNATRGGALEVFPRVNLDEMKLK